MTARACRIILAALLSLSFAALACVGGGGGSWTPPTRTAWSAECLEATRGAAGFPVRLTEMAQP